MKHVNDVKKVSNKKCVSMQKRNKRRNQYKKRGDRKAWIGKEEVEWMMTNPYQYNKGKSYHQ